jgi:hypothetical protein
MSCVDNNALYALMSGMRSELAAIRENQERLVAAVEAVQQDLEEAVVDMAAVNARLDSIEQAAASDWSQEAGRDDAAQSTMAAMLEAVLAMEDNLEAAHQLDLFGWVWTLVCSFIGLFRTPSTALFLVYRGWYMPAGVGRSTLLALGGLADPAAASIFAAALQLQDRIQVSPESFWVRITYGVFRRLTGVEVAAPAAAIPARPSQQSEEAGASPGWWDSLAAAVWGGGNSSSPV